MLIYQTFEINKGLNILKSKSVWHELERVFNNSTLSFSKGSTYRIKKEISQELGTMGWAEDVPVGGSRLYIPYAKQGVGVCFQLGNVCRTHSDILKLQFLICNNVIEVGVLVVPMAVDSKLLDPTHAEFEKLTGELTLFQDFIKGPLAVIGLTSTLC